MSDDNIIHFKPKTEKNPEPNRKPPPMLNIPLVTKILAGTFILVQIIIIGLSYTILPDAENYAVLFAGLVPASWTGATPFLPWTPFTIILFSFVHGGWLHLGVNVLMLVSIGSGLEKSIGVKKYMLIYVGGTIFAALSHIAFAPFSTMPIVGASGGISALFGAMLYMMRTDSYGRTTPILPIIIVWVGISAIGGYLGAPNGSPVAWIAHIGGFLSGIGIMMMLLKHRK